MRSALSSSGPVALRSTTPSRTGIFGTGRVPLFVTAIGLATAAFGCGNAASGSGGGGATTTTTTTALGGGGSGGSGGEPLPDLDPAACPVTADSGADPALAAAAEADWSIDYAAPESGSIEEDKAFFLATLLDADANLHLELAMDATLTLAAQDRDARLRAAPDKCGSDTACYQGELVWLAAEADDAASALVARLTDAGLLAPFAANMRASGRFSLHATASDDELVRAAFLDYTVALGKTLEDETSSLGGTAMHDVVASAAAAHPATFFFHEALLAVDLAALTADERDEAERYEPLAKGENAKALANIPTIDWAKYPFTVILVPGQGPDMDGVNLAPDGQARADLAAQRYAAGLAPIIALSGGHVHPDRTPYSEAIEMKKYLRSTYAIPEEALIVDPHARHTTTNLRNVSRLLYRYGIPTDRSLLVTTTAGQAIYIGFWHGTFGPRCIDELGYLPWRSLVPLSKYDICMVPVAISLHADGRDPLDP
ncbi:MAG: YdcF family protein [Polyangiaceae bacterium]